MNYVSQMHYVSQKFVFQDRFQNINGLLELKTKQTRFEEFQRPSGFPGLQRALKVALGSLSYLDVTKSIVGTVAIIRVVVVGRGAGLITTPLWLRLTYTCAGPWPLLPALPPPLSSLPLSHYTFLPAAPQAYLTLLLRTFILAGPSAWNKHPNGSFIPLLHSGPFPDASRSKRPSTPDCLISNGPLSLSLLPHSIFFPMLRLWNYLLHLCLVCFSQEQGL